jgi:hypothetical protein
MTAKPSDPAAYLRWYVENGICHAIEQGLSEAQARAVVVDLAKGWER